MSVLACQECGYRFKDSEISWSLLTEGCPECGSEDIDIISETTPAPSERPLGSDRGWPVEYLNLPLRQRRFINNFMMTRSRKEYDKLNWIKDCQLYGYRSLADRFEEIAKLHDSFGTLPEKA